RRNTWFSPSKLSIEKILLITYLYCNKYPNWLAMKETYIFEESTRSETIICARENEDLFTFFLRRVSKL
ncbi:hypothetical protein HZS_7115, partial [Henneguya salminicola]